MLLSVGIVSTPIINWNDLFVSLVLRLNEGRRRKRSRRICYIPILLVLCILPRDMFVRNYCPDMPAIAHNCLWFSQNFSILVYANLCIAGAQIWKIFFSGLSLKTLVKRDEWRWDVQILTHSQNDFWWKLMPSESIFLFAGFRYF